MGTTIEDAEKPKGLLDRVKSYLDPVGTATEQAQRIKNEAIQEAKALVADIEARSDALLGKKIAEAEAASQRLIDHAAEQARILKSELLADAEVKFDSAASKKLSEADAMLSKHRLAFEQQTDRLFRRAIVAAGVLLVAAAGLVALLILLNSRLGH